MRSIIRATTAAVCLGLALAQGPPDPNADDLTCEVANIENNIRRVNDACCVPASVCTNGAPDSCNSQCAHVFLKFYNKCYGDLSTLIKGQLDVFDALAVKCQATAPDKSCLSTDHQKQVSQYLKCAETEVDDTQRGVCVARVRTLLGLAGDPGDDPSTHCLQLSLDLPLLEDVEDDSRNGHAASTHGDAYIADGAHFDGFGDYLTVESFVYATDGQFSIGTWFTKESCTGGVYEYLYSHSQRAGTGVSPFSTPNGLPGAPNPTPPNPNVNFYIGCQHNGGGWSSLGGTVVRFNMFDDTGTAVMFDYPAWNSKSFDAVTNVWINTQLVVNQGFVHIYVDGEKVDEAEFGFFVGASNTGIPVECHGNAACNQRTGQPITDHLQKPLGTITLPTAITLGGRMDLDHDRHFKGKLASLTIADHAMTATEIACVFSANDGLLPALPECSAMIAEMMMGGNFELDISFLDSSDDRSGRDRSVSTFGGDVIVTTHGAKFDGDGDYIQIDDIDYETDGDFTIAFWITKNDCGNLINEVEEPYEYLYSHVQNMEGEHTSIDDKANSNVNIYIGCEATTQESTAGGTVLRFNLIDATGVWVLMDYSLEKSATFDQMTNHWTHVVMTVTRHAVSVFVDGTRVADSDFGFPTGQECKDMQIRPSCTELMQSYTCSTDMATLTGGNPQYAGQTLANYCESTCGGCGASGTHVPGPGHSVDASMLGDSAYPYPSVLRSPLTDFDLRSPIFIGARYDLDATRYFKGKIALLKIYSSPLSDAEASCLFHAGDQIMQDAGAADDDGAHHRRMAVQATEMEVEAEEESFDAQELRFDPMWTARAGTNVRSWEVTVL